MADENKKIPNGWVNDEDDDDDYGLIDDTDEDDEDSAWGSDSSFKKKESVTYSNENTESDNRQNHLFLLRKSNRPKVLPCLLHR